MNVIKDGAFRQVGNTVRVPEEPGLGVELDPTAMKRWAAHFAEHGAMGHFNDPNNAGRYRRLPLN